MGTTSCLMLRAVPQSSDGSPRGSRVAVFVLASFGCATSYVPRQSPRVAFTMDGGARKLTRDGKSFGVFEADQAVAGNAEAETEARTYRCCASAGHQRRPAPLRCGQHLNIYNDGLASGASRSPGSP